MKVCKGIRQLARPQSGRRQGFILWRNPTREAPDSGPKHSRGPWVEGHTGRKVKGKYVHCREPQHPLPLSSQTLAATLSTPEYHSIENTYQY